MNRNLLYKFHLLVSTVTGFEIKKQILKINKITKKKLWYSFESVQGILIQKL